VAVSGGLVFRFIGAGIQHTCGLTASGVAYCWGYNGNGQLGDGTTGNHTSPVAVAGGHAFYALSVGDLHTCALTAGGAAYCWGSNDAGQLGDGTTAERWSPTAVSGGRVFQAVSAGSSHTCGLTTGGAAYCWGDNSYDQLGLGAPIDRSSPVAVSGGLVFKDIRGGYGHTCGVTTGGAAYCWGYNESGQVGDGTSGGNSDRTSPVAVLGGLVFQTASVGEIHSCGLTAGGAAYCWGHGWEGQLGYGGNDFTRSTPVAVSGGLVFQAISAASAGSRHTCGLTTGGAAYCWGKNDVGQLGDGGGTNQWTPVAVLGGLVFQSISAGSSHTCGLTTGGAAYCWGVNSGQLGDGTNLNRSSPVAVLGGLVFQAISAGSGHTCGLTPAGAAYCWGGNQVGQLGDGTRNSSTSPVAVSGGLVFQTISTGSGHTCGLTTGGAAYCWGWNNPFGQLGIGSLGWDYSNPLAVVGGFTFKAISAGTFHTCGLTTSGAAYCWGRNEVGRLGDGTALRTTPAAVTGVFVFGAPVAAPAATAAPGLRPR
jgi:alpha-tubulin suppressor-like RCC1 family protein